MSYISDVHHFLPLILLSCEILKNKVYSFGPTYPVHSIETLTCIAAHPDYLATQLLNFTICAQGPLSNNVADMILFERFETLKLKELNADFLAAQPADWPHVEYLSAAGVSVTSAPVEAGSSV
jgi:hypothetical protein